MRLTYVIYEASQCIDKRIGMQRVAYFQVEYAHSKAGKYTTIPFNLALASYHYAWSKVVNAYKVKRRIAGHNTTYKQICHALLTAGAVSTFTKQTQTQSPIYSCCTFYDLITLSQDAPGTA